MESGGEPATAPGVGAPETLVTIVLEELGLIREELKHLTVLTAKVDSLEKRTIQGGEPQTDSRSQPGPSTDSQTAASKNQGVTGDEGIPPSHQQVVSEPKGSDLGNISFRTRTDFIPDDPFTDDISEVSDLEIKSSLESLPIFSGNMTEFQDWVFQHRIVFIRAGLFNFISGEEPKPDRQLDRKAFGKWQDKNLKCICILMKTVSREIREANPDLRNDAPGLWRKLKTDFARADYLTKAQLQESFHTHTFRPGGKAREYVEKMIRLNSDLKARGIHIGDEELKLKLLHGLPIKYEPIRYNLTNDPRITFLQAANVIIADAPRVEEPEANGQANSANTKQKKKKGSDQTNTGSSSNRPQNKNSGNSGSPKRDSGPSTSTGPKKDKSCNICKQLGHWGNRCPEKPPPQCYICDSKEHHAKKCPEKGEFTNYLKTKVKSQANQSSGSQKADPEGSGQE